MDICRSNVSKNRIDPMTECDCSKFYKVHIDADNVMAVLDKLSDEDRGRIVNFIEQVQFPDSFHTSHALNIINRICRYCGQDKESFRKDGSSFYWACENEHCKVHN
jgi:hypothetical protein